MSGWGVLSPKLREVSEPGSLLGRWIAFYCPGCCKAHAFPVEQPHPISGQLWSFDGDVLAPTFSPALNLPEGCHALILEGRIRFMRDSRHALAGQTVDMPDFPDDDY